ncbi:MAG: benzoyl-CoA-dihydrodiol lyase [Planctomycetes bacterium]|nr:benzoyl-CoA-dihydrodiol lyase [Planctomycetota bacterium]
MILDSGRGRADGADPEQAKPTRSRTVAEAINFETEPSKYKHWKLEIEGERARLIMQVKEDQGLRSDYILKLNSYDLGVDIELADAVRRIRYEHPQVKVVVLGGAMDRIFCAGANIMMLRSSTHAFKVNFCKFTNETRLYIEDASENSNIKFLCALNGTASGGGYELAMAADRILLVDDRSSAVSFPETPLLGVLPGTGGLTRLVDKRKVRRDRADVFSTIAEGIKGKRAVEWNLVDDLASLSAFEEKVDEIVGEMAAGLPDKADRKGVALKPILPTIDDRTFRYQYVTMTLGEDRSAEVVLTVPAAPVQPKSGAEAQAAGSDWWVFKAFRELDDCLLRLRLNHDQVGLVLLKTRGAVADILATDATLEALKDDWFVNEVRHHLKRVLKRLDLTAKSLFAIADEGSCFAGTLLEILLAADRSYILNDPDFPVALGVSTMNGGAYPMPNGLSRLQTRFLGEPERVGQVLEALGEFDAERADELGLATSAPDEIDWEDELRVAIEERVSFSPDALTGMEANLRFAGPETMETKIFGRLSAWQNWIFQRPNAVGERGALTCYGTPNRPEFNFQRT